MLVDPAAVTHPISIKTFEVTGVSDSSIAGLRGADLLNELSVLPTTQVAEFVASHPSSVTSLIASPPAATAVTDWWSSLTPTAQRNLGSAAPQLIGNLNGIPATVRNTANRAWVATSLSTLKVGLAKIDGRALATGAQQHVDMLKKVATALKQSKHGPARTLLSVDPSGTGKAAVVIGDLDTADYVTYMVPGMFYTVDGQLTDWTGDAADLYSQQVSWLHRLSAVDPADANKTVAVVAWMGYQTPDLTNIGSLDLAYKGRDALASAIEGLQSERASNEPYVTVIAHSYGSTAALMALTEDSFSVNALALVGSPGSAAQSVHDLHVKNANVFVGAAAWDPVPNSAYFGSDPSAPSYGAKTMAVSGATDEITGTQLAGSIGHNGYFDKGSESIRNMALIGIGQGELVMRGNAGDANRTLALVH